MKINFDFEIFKTSGEEFLHQLLVQMRLLGFAEQGLKPDHLCFRVESEQEYNDYKNELLQHANLLSEAEINGRPICTFLLKNGFKINHKIVQLLELPFPKKQKSYKTGFEHAEFVISERFVDFAGKHPNLHFKRSGPKNFNAELVLKTSAGVAKFHHLSLDRVIEIEDSKITEILFDFDGTVIESRQHIYAIHAQVFSKILGREVDIDEVKSKYHSEFIKLFKEFQITESQMQKEFLSQWFTLSKNIHFQVFPGTHEFLTDLKKNGYRLHLWTARDEQSAMAILAQHDLIGFFESLSFSNQQSSKPQAINLKFDFLTAKANSLLMVGDTATDVIAAHNIKAISVGAAWELEIHETDLRAAGVDVCFYCMNDFKIWLNDRRT